MAVASSGSEAGLRIPEMEANLDASQAGCDTDSYADGTALEEANAFNELLLERKKRLRELEATLHAQAARTVEPQLRRALGQVEDALDRAREIAPLVEDQLVNKKPTSVPKLHLPGQSAPKAQAQAPLSARAANHNHGNKWWHGTNARSPLSARGSSRDRVTTSSGTNLSGINPWFSSGMAGTGSSPSSPRLSSPRSASVQSPRSRSFGFQPSGRKSKLATIATTTRSPTVAAICKELEELLRDVPARYLDPIESVFARLIGDMGASELRFASQMKVGEELQGKLGRSPSTAASLQKLRESEETYRRHIERLAARDRVKAVRAAESIQLSGKEGQLMAEVASLREERKRALKHQRAAQEAMAEQHAKNRAQLVALQAQIEAKKRVQRQFQGLMPAARRVYDEQLALRRRIDKLNLYDK